MPPLFTQGVPDMPLAPDADALAEVHELLGEEQWRSAEGLCAFLLAADPTPPHDAALRVAMGDACAGLRQFPRALSYYQQALKRRPFAAKPTNAPRSAGHCAGAEDAPLRKRGGAAAPDAEAMLRLKLGRVCLACGTGHDVEAIEHLRNIDPEGERAGQPQRPLQATMLLAALHRRRGSHAAAANEYWRALQRSRWCVDALRGWVEAQRVLLCHSGAADPERGAAHWEEAAQRLRRLYTQPQGVRLPGLAAAVLRWAEMQRLRLCGSYREALAVGRQLQQERTVLPVAAEMAECYYRLQRAPEALGLCARIRAADAHAVGGLDVYSMLLSKLGRRAELERLAADAVRHAPHAEEAWVAAAVARPPSTPGDGADRRLLEYAERAIALNPGSTRGHLLAAKELLRGRRYDEARRCYLAAQRVSRDVTSYQGLVGVYLQERKAPEAYAAAKEAVALFPDSPHARSILGLVLRRLHRPQAAAECYNVALHLDPEHTDAVVALASLEFEDGRRREAIARLRAAERTEQALVELGRLCSADGDLDAARVAFEEALSMHPHSARAREGLRGLRRIERDGDDSDDDDDDDGAGE